MDSKAVLVFFARKIRAARRAWPTWLHRHGTTSEASPPAPQGKARRRFRFLRWALAVQLLKGAAYAGGGILVQVLLTRVFGA